jgi:(p)ppGpp synthase/HD superfamily hydrolase
MKPARKAGFLTFGGFMNWTIVEKAKHFATCAHHSQRYGVHPYTFHLSGVVKVAGIRDTFPDLRPVVLAVCWLHDTIEDTNTSFEELEEAFGWEVAHAVVLVTKVEGQSYEEYMRGILTSPIAIEVKKCDTMFNLSSSFKEGNQKRIAKYIKQLDILERGYV